LISNSSPSKLQSFSAEGEKYKFPEENPFIVDDEDEESEDKNSPVASVGYRYRKWDLGNDVKLVARCEHDAVVQGNTEKDILFMNIKALNEWDSRFAGNVDWRQKLDSQRGAGNKILTNDTIRNWIEFT
jgi:translation initiation factor 3 subunit D